MIKKHLIILLILLAAISCRKDEEIPYCEQYPDDCVDVREVKDYFYFNYGSWWVYEEENSGKRDSVYVLETGSDTSSVLFSTELYSTYDGYEYRFWTSGVHPSVKNNISKKSIRSTQVYRSKGKPGDYVAEAECLMFYPQPGFWTYTYGGGYIGYDNILKVESVLASYNVIGRVFFNVVIVSEEHTAIEEQQPTLHYYSPNIGLIKKELLDSHQVWNLVDYYIVK
jgi:hypothetical protein